MTEKDKQPTVKTGGQTSSEQLVEIKEALDVSKAAYTNFSTPLSEAHNKAVKEGRKGLTKEEKQQIVCDALEKSPGWTKESAKAFSERYEVISSADQNYSGMRATLFNDTVKDKKAIGVSGTNFPNENNTITDFVKDLTSNALIGLHGGSTVKFDMINVVGAWREEGYISINDDLYIAGNSNPQASIPDVKYAHSDLIDRAYTFSGPGVGGIGAELFGPEYKYDEDVTTAFVKQGPNIINNFGTPYADTVVIFDHPDDGISYAHSPKQIGEAIDHEIQQRAFDQDYEIQNNDTLSKIAKDNNVDLKDLLDANPHISNPNHIRPGQNITIPKSKHRAAKTIAAGDKILESKLSKTLHDMDAHRKSIQSIREQLEEKRAIQKIEDSPAIQQEIRNLQEQLSQAGQGLSASQSQFKTLTDRARQQRNGPDNQFGQASTGKTPFSSPRQHTVAKNQTLSGIAKQYGVTVKSLVDLNNIQNPNHIRAGQNLNLPSAEASITPKSYFVEKPNSQPKINPKSSPHSGRYRSKDWNREISRHHTRDVARSLDRSGIGHSRSFVGRDNVTVKDVHDSIVDHYGSRETARQAVERAYSSYDYSTSQVDQEFMRSLRDSFNDRNDRPSGGGGGKPVLIDLNGNGEIEIIPHEDNKILFDVNGDADGYKEHTDWVGPEDAMLVFDENDDGEITENHEISFASLSASARTDLEGLDKVFNTNGDAVLDQKDKDWNKLKIWQDKNSNAIAEPGELKTLDEFGVESIAMTSNGIQSDIHNSKILGYTLMMTKDYNFYNVADVSFGYDTEYNYKDTENFQIIYDHANKVQIAIAKTPQKEINLEELKTQIYQADHLCNHIIPSKQGGYINGGFGFDTVDFSKYGKLDLSVEDSKKWVLESIENYILAQGKNNFKGTKASETITVKNGSGFIDGAGGENTISFAPHKKSASISLEKGTAGSFKLKNIQHITGTHQDDHITGDNQNNIINPGLGKDIVDGKGGIDYISLANSDQAVNIDLLKSKTIDHPYITGDTYKNIEGYIGSLKNDVMIGDNNDNYFGGGNGNDALEGGAGNDTYLFQRSTDDAENIDVVQDYTLRYTVSWVLHQPRHGWKTQLKTPKYYDGGKKDKVVFGASIKPEDIFVQFLKDKPDTLLVSLHEGQAGNYQQSFNHLVLQNWKQPFYRIESFEFSNGETFSQAEILGFMGTHENDVIDLSKPIVSGVNSHLVNHKNIRTYEGDDQITGGQKDDKIDPGPGNDTVNGHDGNDYIWGSLGSDTLQGGKGTDTVSYIKSDEGISVNLTSQSHKGQLVNGDTIHTDIEQIFMTSHDDQFIGRPSAEIVKFGRGNDVIYSSPGADTYDGGKDSDLISYENSPSAISYNFHSKKGEGNHIAGDQFKNFETFKASSHDDTIHAGPVTFKIDGHDGHDHISFAEAPDAVALMMDTQNHRGSFAKGLNFTNFELISATHHNDKINDDAQGYDYQLLAGDDLYWSGQGANKIDGGQGYDRVSYHRSPEAISLDLTTQNNQGGHAAGDIITNIERIDGSLLDDHLRGDKYDNEFHGLNGHDHFIATSGNDFYDGGSGHNSLSYEHMDAAITIKSHDGLVFKSNQTQDKFENIFEIIGSNFDDQFTADDHNRVYRGGKGSDSFVSTLGENIFDGGEGDNDNISYAYAPLPVRVDIQNNLAHGIQIPDRKTNELPYLSQGTQYQKESLIDIEHVAGSEYNDHLLGNEKSNILHGRDGHDYIEGRVGHDFLYGEKGHDKINGGEGNDHLYGGDGNDILNGENGDDHHRGDKGSDIFIASIGADTYDGGTDNDMIDYVLSPEGVIVNLNGEKCHGGYAEGDRLHAVEVVQATHMNDSLYGNDDNNRFILGLGDDIAFGGKGNDSFLIDHGRKIIDGGEGEDSVKFINHDTDVLVNLRLDNWQSGYQFQFTSIENVTTGRGNDLIIGHDQDNILCGHDGHDVIKAGPGNDVLSGGSGHNILDGGDDNDTVTYADSPNSVNISLAANLAHHGDYTDTILRMENVTGSAFNDTIEGNDQDNKLCGKDGDDIFKPGKGNDQILGGRGEDKVIYKPYNEGVFIANFRADLKTEILVLNDIHRNEVVIFRNNRDLIVQSLFRAKDRIVVQDWFLRDEDRRLKELTFMERGKALQYTANQVENFLMQAKPPTDLNRNQPNGYQSLGMISKK